jgi:hypothetical protein
MTLQIRYHPDFKSSDTLLFAGSRGDIERLLSFFQKWNGEELDLLERLQAQEKLYLHSATELCLRRDKDRNDFIWKRDKGVWIVSKAYQDQIVGLLEGLLAGDNPGHQYLHYFNFTGPVQIMVSKDEYPLPANDVDQSAKETDLTNEKSPDDATADHKGIYWLMLALALAVALILHFAFHLAWGWSTLSAFVGWPLIGTLITFDDDLPGGWSNPDGKRRPDWFTAPFWAQICAGLSISSFASILDIGLRNEVGVGFGLVGLCAGFVAFLLLRWARTDSRAATP